MLELLVEPVLDLPARQELAFAACEWRFVDLKGHADRRLVDLQRRQCLGLAAIAYRVRYVQVLDAAEDDDVAGANCLDRAPFETMETKEIHDLFIRRRTVAAHDRNRRVGLDDTAADAADAEHADVGVVIQARDLQL